MNFTITNRVSFYKMYWKVDGQVYKHVNVQVYDLVCGQDYWLIHAQINPMQTQIKREINK